MLVGKPIVHEMPMADSIKNRLFRKILFITRNSPIGFASAFFFMIVFMIDWTHAGWQHFSFLADSFINFKTYFLSEVPRFDASFFNGNYYWPLGPFPAVMLMPLVSISGLFGKFFCQGYIQPFLVVLTFTTCVAIAKKNSYSKGDSLYIAYAFCFSSVFLGVSLVDSSWYFAQLIAVFLMLLSISEFLGKKRHWVIGSLMGCIVATRMTMGIGIVFFGLDILFSKFSIKHKISRLLEMLLPFLFAVACLLLYNHSRFGSFFEQGYSYQSLVQELSDARDYGMFSFSHVASNLYYSLINVPRPVFSNHSVLEYPFIKADPWGMSIFLTSPFLISLFFLKFKDRISSMLLLTSFMIAMPALLYYASGWYQFGYRYALDYLPFLFLLFMRNYRAENRELSWKMKMVILASSFINLHLFFTVFYG